jgi:hypothetical protein
VTIAQGLSPEIFQHIQDSIRQLSELTQYDRSFNLQYNMRCINWLDQYIDSRRSTTSQQQKAHLATLIGCFLGQAIVSNFKAHWIVVDNTSLVQLDGGCINPISCVMHFILDASEDNLASIYSLMPLVEDATLDAESLWPA